MACLVRFSFSVFSVSVLQMQILQLAQSLYEELRAKSRHFSLFRQFISTGFLRDPQMGVSQIASPGPTGGDWKGPNCASACKSTPSAQLPGSSPVLAGGVGAARRMTRRIEDWPVPGHGCVQFNLIVTQESTGAALDLARPGTILHKVIHQNYLRKQTGDSSVLIVA